jgi:uncharacterized protein (TIGR02679 family)
VSRAVDILGKPELAWIVHRLRDRAEAGQPLGERVRLDRPTPVQTDAFARLFGYPRGRALVLEVEALADLLRNAGAGTIEEMLVAIGGPLVQRRAATELEAARWEAVYALLSSWQDWVADLRQTGLLRRAAGGDTALAGALVTQAAAVASRLPAKGILLSELASAVTGDAHALDPGAPLSALVLRHVTRLGGTDGTDRRAAWSAVGVDLDSVSSSVLVLNVRAEGTGPAPGVLAACAEAGEPARLTLRQVRSLTRVRGAVFVCENPSIVGAAADRLGAGCAPLVCTEGQPRAAARVLLRLCGGPVRYHGDFDWPGIRIANDVLALTGGTPWRMTPEDYDSAPKGNELSGAPVSPGWSEALGVRMGEVGRAVHEEAVLDELLGDLTLSPLPHHA